MANHDNSSASPTAIKNANAIWDNFVKISQICGVAIAITLLIMAVFLV